VIAAAPASVRGVRTIGGVALLRLVLLTLLVASLLAPAAASAQPAVAGAVRHVRPHDGVVLRGFEPPTSAFGPGHRGVDLDARPGDVVRASADGTVTFVGTVDRTRWVSIAHGDGVVTSYGPIDEPTVRSGRAVARGDAIGRLAAGPHGNGERGLHWGARRDGRYIDPLSLVGDALPRPSLVDVGGWRGTDHAVVPYEPWGGGSFGGWRYAPSPVADRQGFAVPPNPNHLVVVSGLGTSSDTSLIDTGHLGYDPGNVTRFSYAGTPQADHRLGPRIPTARPVPSVGRSGASPERSPGLLREQAPFGAADTWAGIDVAARRLRDQLRDQARREPGRAVDLFGHSMGGVVIARYLTEHHDPYDRSLPPIGNVVTVASPHRGSDVATLGAAVRDHSVLGPAVTGLRTVLSATDLPGLRDLGRLSLEVDAIDHLAVGSPELRRLAEAWQRGQAAGAAGPFAMGTRVLTIGGGGDLVVPTLRSGPPTTGPVHPWFAVEPAGPVSPTGSPTTEHRVLPGNHHAVLETEALREVVWRFLADQEVVDSPGRLARGTSAEHAGALQVTSTALRLHDTIWLPIKRGLPTPTVPAATRP
jgi:murein DD-endopeptidase MepM/ murein hydrolase activator NlpD